MYKSTATVFEHHLAKLTHRATQVEAASDSDTDTAQPVVDVRSSGNSPDPAGQTANSPPTVSSALAKKIQDILPVFSSFTSTSGLGSSRSTPSTPHTKLDDARSPVQDTPLTVPNFEDSPSEHGWQSFWSGFDRFRPQHGKKSEPASTPAPSQDEVLDCVDDNNSFMMYGPLEPDDASEVEIACSEIVSISGDGEVIRTPQPRFIPLPSESFDEVVVGSPGRSPGSRFIPLPFESIDQVLGGFSPRLQLSPLPLESIDRVLSSGGGRSPQPRSAPLHLESIDRILSSVGVRSPRPRVTPLSPGSTHQVLGGGSNSDNGNEPEFTTETAGAARVPPAAESARDQPVKEYRIWLPSLTKISVQTMWWGFRIYLPPPVLDVLNNRQLEAVKRAALITTALQWLMEHLPVALLPPQVRPGVTVLRHLVPYVGYMGGFIAWGWSAIRSFDKGYGVVLTATWLLPFVLIPGTWEANLVPGTNTEPSTPSTSS